LKNNLNLVFCEKCKNLKTKKPKSWTLQILGFLNLKPKPKVKGQLLPALVENKDSK